MTITYDIRTHIIILARGNHADIITYIGIDSEGLHTFAIQHNDGPVEYLAHRDFHYVAHVAYKWARQQVRYNYHAIEER